MLTLYLKFTDRPTAIAAFTTLNLYDSEEESFTPQPGDAIHEVGQIWDIQPTYDGDGNQLSPGTYAEGWHFNLLVRDRSLAEQIVLYCEANGVEVVRPATPSCRFAANNTIDLRYFLEAATGSPEWSFCQQNAPTVTPLLFTSLTMAIAAPSPATLGNVQNMISGILQELSTNGVSLAPEMRTNINRWLMLSGISYTLEDIEQN